MNAIPTLLAMFVIVLGIVMGTDVAILTYNILPVWAAPITTTIGVVAGFLYAGWCIKQIQIMWDEDGSARLD
jgi:riboflavin transporter FmnP